MAIPFSCPCGVTLSARDDMAGRQDICPGCGARVDIPDPANEPQMRICTGCGREDPGASASCPSCGWDSNRRVRKCFKCGGPVTLQYAGDGFVGAIGLGGAVGMFFVVKFFGVLGAAAIFCGLGALGGLLVALSLRYECGMCSETAGKALLGPDERREMGRKRVVYFGTSLGLGAAAILMGAFWLWVVIRAYEPEVVATTYDNVLYGSKPPADHPIPEPDKKLHELPAAPTAQEAAMFLTSPPNIYVANRTDYERAVDALFKGMPADEAVEVLAFVALESKVPHAEQAAAKALETNASKIPDYWLSIWLSTPATHQRFARAARFAIVGRKYGVILENLASVSPENLPALLEALRDVDSADAKPIVTEALRLAPPAQAADLDGPVMGLVGKPGFKIDDHFAREMDAFITRMPASRSKERWSRWWDSRVDGAHDVLSGEYRTARATTLLEQGVMNDSSAGLLLRAGKHRLVLDALRTEKDPAKRRDIESRLELAVERLPKGEALEGLIAIAGESSNRVLVARSMKALLADPSTTGGRLSSLLQAFPKVEEARNRGWILENIKMAVPYELRREEQVSSAFYAKGAEDPEADVRVAAVRAACKSPWTPAPWTVGAWKILQEEKNASARLKLENEYLGWVRQGIASIDNQSIDSIPSLQGPIASIIESVSDPVARATLEKTQRRKLVDCLNSLDARRQESVATLLRFALHGDDEIAVAAVAHFPYDHAKEAGLLTALPEVLRKSKSTAVRKEILRRLRWLEDPGVVGVLREGLSDKDVEIRQMSFEALRSAYQRGKDRNIASLLQNAHAAERDAKLKESIGVFLKGLPR